MLFVISAKETHFNKHVKEFKEELVSVVVPVFNAEVYLPHCLQSIASQTYKNLEILLIDDGSTDNSGRLCDEYAARDSRARVIHQENRKLWATRNRGLSEAKGAYVFFPDADDCFHPEMIRILHNAINLEGKAYPMAMCGLCKTTSYISDYPSLPSTRPIVLSQEEVFEKAFSDNNLAFSVTWNKLFRTDILDSTFQREYLRGQDLDSNLRFYQKVDSIVCVENTLYYWVQHPGQLTRAADNLDLSYECLIRMFSRNLRDLSGESQKYKHYYLDKLYKRMAIYKARVIGHPEKMAIDAFCRKVERETVADLLHCKEIPVIKRIGLLLFLHGGALTRLWLKTTHNL